MIHDVVPIDIGARECSILLASKCKHVEALG